MTDDWWTQAVVRFDIDAPMEPWPDSADAPPVPPEDEAASASAPLSGSKRRRRRAGIDFLVIAVVATGVALLLRTFVVEQFAVDGESMLSTMDSGDRVLVNKLSYELHDPRHGDVVVLKDSNGALADRDLIKRVVALPGETVEYRDCQLFVDGRLVSEPYLDPAIVQADHCGDDQPPVKVAPEHVFVMGDNRDASLDSRTSLIGQVAYANLIGRAFVILWPRPDWRWL